MLLKHTVYHMGLGDNGRFIGLLGTETGTNYIQPSASVVNDDSWHLYTLVYDGIRVKVYVDAQEIYEREITGHVKENIRDVYLGKDPWGTTFDGAIDEVQIFNTALNQTEITDIFCSSSPTC